MPLCKTIDDFREQIISIGKGEIGEYKTLVIDSLKFLEGLMFKDICSRESMSSINDTRTTTGDKLQMGHGFSLAMVEFMKLTDLLDRFIEKGISVVVISHSTERSVKDPRVDEYESTTLDVGKWGRMYDPAKWIESWSDCVLYLAEKVYTLSKDTGINDKRTTATTTGERIIYTEKRPAFLAKNRFGMPPELPYVKGEGYKVIEQYLTVSDKEGK